MVGDFGVTECSLGVNREDSSDDISVSLDFRKLKTKISYLGSLNLLFIMVLTA